MAVHGGAGPRRPERDAATRAAIRDALDAAAAVLARSALDAVQAAVELLEDRPGFNAGRGSVPTADGTVEMDAAIMDGAGRRAGAVACVRGVRHPIALARAVMERTPHAFLAGPGAERLADELGVERKAAEWFRPAAGRGAEPRGGDASGPGTVGAVALDADGHLAAATSTGGVRGQLAGRIGDSPIVGAGTYAADGLCAVSATGDGEPLIRAVAAHEVGALLLHAGLALDDAAARALDGVTALGGTGGLIAVDARGAVALPFTTGAMARGVWRPGAAARVGVGSEALA